MGYAPVVQYERSFLIVGGNNDSDSALDTIIRYAQFPLIRDAFWRLVQFLGERLVLGNKFTVTIEIYYEVAILMRQNFGTHAGN